MCCRGGGGWGWDLLVMLKLWVYYLCVYANTYGLCGSNAGGNIVGTSRGF